MPREYLMSWDERHARWHKMYRGRRMAVSCRQLGLPGSHWTKQASYQAANAWWARRKAEIDMELAPPPHPHAERLAELAHRRSWAEGHGADVEARHLEAERARVEAGGEPVDPGWALREAWRSMGLGDPPDDPGRLLDFFGVEAVWRDRLAREPADAPPSPAPAGLAEAIDAYLASQRLAARAGQRSAAEVRNREHALRIFRAFAESDPTVRGAGGRLQALDGAAWQRFHDHLLSRVEAGEHSTTYAAKTLRYARRFLAHLAGIAPGFEPPRNLGDLKITARLPPVEVFAPDEVRTLHGRATGQLRLHILLALNCGFTAQDISDLHPREVDWSAGTITRRRGKTAAHPNVPTVSYELWPETLALLREHRSDDAAHVLLTTTGREWVDREARNTDSVRANWRHLMRYTGIRKPFKLLRKTGATLVEELSDPRAAELYLGHAPQTIREIHYTQSAPERLRLALRRVRARLFPDWSPLPSPPGI